MTKIKLAVMLVLATAGTASAGGKADSLGIGAEYQINGIAGGVSANYDLGKFHVGGFLAFADGGNANDTNYSLGGRFFYHIGSTAMSDFGVGGSLGFYSQDGNGMAMNRRDTLLFLEPGFQIRAFIASNVALSFTAGFVLGLNDADGVSLGGGQVGLGTGMGTGGGSLSAVTATAGIHYYFGD